MIKVTTKMKLWSSQYGFDGWCTKLQIIH